jgi:hypothetical protein
MLNESPIWKQLTTERAPRGPKQRTQARLAGIASRASIPRLSREDAGIGLGSTTERLIERCKAAIGAESDYRLAKVLKVSHTALLHWRSGRARPDDLTVIRMSALIGIDPARVVVRLHAERAKDPETRALWLRIADSLPRGDFVGAGSGSPFP